MTPEMIAKQLGETGLCVCPNFLNSANLADIMADLAGLRLRGEMHRAGTGQGSEQQIQDQVRRDDICWLDRAVANPVHAVLWQRLDLLQVAFNRTLFLGLHDFEGHYAVYPVGGFYRRHLDSFQQGGIRVVSLILYLNHEWKKMDGGELRVYEKDGSFTGIDPIGGTLVCFLSQESEHEVMPSFRTRASFVGWYRRT